MKKAKIGELKNNLSRYLDHVRAGGSVVVFDRDQPIARIVPLDHAQRVHRRTSDDRLARLERQGLIRRGTGKLPAWFGRRRPPKIPGGSLLKELLDERQSGW